MYSLANFNTSFTAFSIIENSFKQINGIALKIVLNGLKTLKKMINILY